mgnify:CR=1 FL=1
MTKKEFTVTSKEFKEKYLNSVQKKRNKKFYLSLICDYVENLQTKDIDFVLSKGKIMCWLSFFGLFFLALSQFFMKEIDSTVLSISTGVLQSIFATTFVYEGAKRGIKTYENIKKETDV